MWKRLLAAALCIYLWLPVSRTPRAKQHNYIPQETPFLLAHVFVCAHVQSATLLQTTLLDTPPIHIHPGLSNQISGCASQKKPFSLFPPGSTRALKLPDTIYADAKDMGMVRLYDVPYTEIQLAHNGAELYAKRHWFIFAVYIQRSRV